MMAARAMSSGASTTCRSAQGMVTACESYLPMVKLMKKVLRLNGMENNIKVINKRSDELKVGVDIPSRANVLVSNVVFFKNSSINHGLKNTTLDIILSYEKSVLE